MQLEEIFINDNAIKGITILYPFIMDKRTILHKVSSHFDKYITYIVTQNKNDIYIPFELLEYHEEEKIQSIIDNPLVEYVIFDNMNLFHLIAYNINLKNKNCKFIFLTTFGDEHRYIMDHNLLIKLNMNIPIIQEKINYINYHKLQKNIYCQFENCKDYYVIEKKENLRAISNICYVKDKGINLKSDSQKILFLIQSIISKWPNKQVIFTSFIDEHYGIKILYDIILNLLEKKKFNYSENEIFLIDYRMDEITKFSMIQRFNFSKSSLLIMNELPNITLRGVKNLHIMDHYYFYQIKKLISQIDKDPFDFLMEFYIGVFLDEEGNDDDKKTIDEKDFNKYLKLKNEAINDYNHYSV